MDEKEFWTKLAYRLTHECEDPRFRVNKYRPYPWCDGLSPYDYEFDNDPPRIRGDAWFGQSGQEEWSFTLELPWKPKSVEEINWSKLIPPGDAASWITIEWEKKHLLFQPPLS